MADRDPLYVLIHSMTKNEKRYFKVKHLTNKRSNIFKLFDAVSQQKSYDEKALKHKFRNENFIKHLTVIKIQLQDKILCSLSEFHVEKNMSMKIIQKLTDASTLFQRGLYEPARKYLARAKELIIEHERYDLLPIHARKQATFWQQEIFVNTTNEEIKSFENFAIDGIKNVIDEMKLLSNMQRMNKISKTIGYANSEIDLKLYDDILNEKILQNVKKLHTTKNKYNFYFVKSLYYNVIKDEEKCLKNSLKALEVVQHKAEKNSSYISGYIGALANTTSYLLTFRQYRYFRFFKTQLEKVEKMIVKAKPQSSQYWLEFLKLSELRYTLLAGIVDADEQVKQLIEDLKSVDTNYNSLNVNSILYHIAYGKFYLKEYDNCLDYLDKLDKKNNRKNSSFLISSTLLRLITYYEKQDYAYLNSLLRNTKRTLEKYDFYEEHEVKFFQFMKKILRYSSDMDKKIVFIESYAKYLKSLGNTDWNALIAFNFEDWLQSLIPTHKLP